MDKVEEKLDHIFSASFDYSTNSPTHTHTHIYILLIAHYAHCLILIRTKCYEPPGLDLEQGWDKGEDTQGENTSSLSINRNFGFVSYHDCGSVVRLSE